MLLDPITGGSGLPAMAGQALRRLRVNEGATASEWENDATNVINAEEARSDIRSTTRPGYSSFNSYAGLQALIDSVGEYATILLPSNGVFDLGGNLIETKAEGQGIVSLGSGAELKNGGIKFSHRLERAENLFITGAAPIYGIHFSNDLGPASTQDRFATSNRTYFTHRGLFRVFIKDKEKGVYINKSAVWNRIEDIRIWNCTEGLTVEMLDYTGDTGHFILYGVHIQSCSSAGMRIIKNGGFTATACKMWDCPTNLLIEPTTDVEALTNGPQGLYFANCQFEDPTAGGVSVKVSAASGVSSSRYPRNIEFVGGTMHGFLFDKFKQITLAGVLLAGAGSFTYNTPGVDLQIYGGGCDPESIDILNKLAGSGRDYVIYGSNPTNGPFIKTGRKMKFIDAYGSAFLGSYLTSIASAPNYIGQRALVAGTWYTAVGTSSSSDWSSSGGSGGDLDGGSFSESYTYTSNVDAGAF